MDIFIGWVIFSFVLGMLGSGRKIGFFGAFFLSLLLSPIIGLIFVLVSKNEEDELSKEKILNTQNLQQETLKDLSYSKSDSFKTNSIADELEKLRALKDDNSITLEEFNQLKSKIINS